MTIDRQYTSPSFPTLSFPSREGIGYGSFEISQLAQAVRTRNRGRCQIARRDTDNVTDVAMPLKLISREPCGITACRRILDAASSAHNGSVQRQDPGSLEKLEDRQKVSLRRVALGRIMASHVNLHDPGSMPCQGENGGHCSWHIDEQRPRRPAERNASTPATCVKETLSCGQDILAYLDGVQFEGGKQKALGMFL